MCLPIAICILAYALSKPRRVGVPAGANPGGGVEDRRYR